MSNSQSFRATRMKEAMDRAGLSSGQVAIRMNVSGGAVRGWTTGRRGVGPDELVEFAKVVNCPVEYFLNPDYNLPSDFSLRTELRKLNELVEQLTEKVESEPGFRLSGDEEAIEYLRRAHNLSNEDVTRIRQIIEQEQKNPDAEVKHIP